MSNQRNREELTDIEQQLLEIVRSEPDATITVERKGGEFTDLVVETVVPPATPFRECRDHAPYQTLIYKVEAGQVRHVRRRVRHKLGRAAVQHSNHDLATGRPGVRLSGVHDDLDQGL